jgi:hypothetical protein
VQLDGEDAVEGEEEDEHGHRGVLAQGGHVRPEDPVAVPQICWQMRKVAFWHFLLNPIQNVVLTGGPPHGQNVQLLWHVAERVEQPAYQQGHHKAADALGGGARLGDSALPPVGPEIVQDLAVLDDCDGVEQEADQKLGSNHIGIRCRVHSGIWVVKT